MNFMYNYIKPQPYSLISKHYSGVEYPPNIDLKNKYIPIAKIIAITDIIKHPVFFAKPDNPSPNLAVFVLFLSLLFALIYFPIK